MNSAADDVLARRPVWQALSDLFLDTELSPEIVEYLGRTLAASPYSLDELEEILYGEVYPVCIGNLQCVAGEWAGFDPDWLEAAVLRRQRAWLRIPRCLQTSHWMIREPWERIQAEFEIHRRQMGQT